MSCASHYLVMQLHRYTQNAIEKQMHFFLMIRPTHDVLIQQSGDDPSILQSRIYLRRTLEVRARLLPSLTLTVPNTHGMSLMMKIQQKINNKQKSASHFRIKRKNHLQGNKSFAVNKKIKFITQK